MKSQRTCYRVINLYGLFIMLSLFFVNSDGNGQTVVDRYIQLGLEENLVLQEKGIAFAQAENALKIARSYFLPALTILGDYTSGKGGRSIHLPIGELLNPVYRSLNELTATDRFAEVQNVTENFFPDNFYDARIRASLPILNADLIQMRRIEQLNVVMKSYEVDAYKRQLVFDIKSAYFNYLSAEASVKIYESALELMNKNVEINESLQRNGKALPSQLHRLRSETQSVNADLTFARSRADNARRYFNFLLNRDPEAAIEMSPVIVEDGISGDVNTGVDIREELKMLTTATYIQEEKLAMAQLSRLPKINAFVDLGSQASDWQYNSASRYYLAGVQLSVPIFQGLRTQSTIRHQKFELRKNHLQVANVKARLSMAVEVARSELDAAIENVHAAREQLKSAESYFRLTGIGYRNGIHSLIEMLDARNNLTRSQLQVNLRSLDVMIARAKMERETASYPLNN